MGLGSIEEFRMEQSAPKAPPDPQKRHDTVGVGVLPPSCNRGPRCAHWTEGCWWDLEDHIQFLSLGLLVSSVVLEGIELGMVAQVCNLSFQKVEAGRSHVQS